MNKHIVSFFVRGYAQTKGSAKAFFRKGMRYPVITNDNTKTKGWDQTIKAVAQNVAPEQLWTGPIALEFVFYMKKPKNHPKTRRLWHTKKPDLDKIIRAAKDALTGVIYADDSQVVRIIAYKQYSDLPGMWARIVHWEGLKPICKTEGGTE